MARIFIPPERISFEGIPLQSKEMRYLLRVLRLHPGEEVTVFDGEGREYRCVLLEEGGRFSLEVKEEREGIGDSPLRVTLAQGILKGEKMKWVIQKATELGVARIIPLATQRSIPLLEEERGELRVQRWRRIAQEAARQSARGTVPQIEAISTLRDISKEGKGLLLWEEGETPLREVLRGWKRGGEVTVIIGPEGGLAEEEVMEGERMGYQVATLGKRILRAETAALSVLSILQYLLGDLG